MPPITLSEVLVLAVVLAPIALAFYLGWRFVRALESRKGSVQQVSALTSEVRGLRAQVEIMAEEIGDGALGAQTVRKDAAHAPIGRAGEP